MLPASVQGAVPRPRDRLRRRRRGSSRCPHMPACPRHSNVLAPWPSPPFCSWRRSLLGSGLTATSAGDLQSQISAGKSAAASLRVADRHRDGANPCHHPRPRRREPAARPRWRAPWPPVRRSSSRAQSELIQARDHLVDLENRLQSATRALAANLVASYEQGRPDLMTRDLRGSRVQRPARAGQLPAPNRHAGRPDRERDPRRPSGRGASSRAAGRARAARSGAGGAGAGPAQRAWRRSRTRCSASRSPS